MNDGSAPITFTWRGVTLRARHTDGRWIIIRGGQALAGPVALEVENWSVTLCRIREWLDQHAEGSSGEPTEPPSD